MKLVKVQFSPWDKVYIFNAETLDLIEGDKVIVKTELGTEMGDIVGFIGDKDSNKDKSSEVNGKNCQNNDLKKITNDKDIKPVLRKANSLDMEKVIDIKERKKALEFCIQKKDKYKLPMKLIDAHFSYDGSRLTFAFIADGRVDFRELVKDLTRHFGRTIRLQQIGIRDEAKIMGDYGHCGRELCCKGFLCNLSSITSEMAELQQCSHRGSERISGVCGRLMCCLAYEHNGYEDLDKKLPSIGATVKVEGKKGQVIGHNPLKQTVNIEFSSKNGEGSTFVELSLDKIK